MTGLILAGGRGTRLRPHTEEIPKPLLEINNKAILSYQLDMLSSLNVSPIVIVTGFLAHKIEDYVQAHYPDLKVIFANNAQFEDSRPAFGVISALPHLDDDVLYLNGDVHCDLKVLSDVINSAHESATAIQKAPWDEEQVNVVLDPDMNIRHIGKNITEADNYGEFIGITKLSKEFVEEIKKTVDDEGAETFRYSFAVDLINHVINIRKKRLFAVDVTASKAIEVDTAEDLARANTMQ